MALTRLSPIEDLSKIATDDDDYELIEGVLAPLPPRNFEHGVVQANVASTLFDFVHENSFGKVVGRVGFTLGRNPDTVLAPDLAFIAAARYPEETAGFPELAPDLLVEVISSSNTPGETERKMAIYLEAGVKVIWIVYPRQRQIVEHAPGNPPAVFTDADSLTGGDLLPGLAIPVADVYA